MASKIEWMRDVWKPVVGRSMVSGRGERHFSGEVRTVDAALSWPLKRKTPTVWFVNSMGDLFHKDVPFDFVDQVFAVMALCPQHTFQVLTKRSVRMAAYLSRGVEEDDGWEPGSGARFGIGGVLDNWMRGGWEELNLMEVWDERVGLRLAEHLEQHDPVSPWPLPNVWIGTSVEDQRAADERIPHLLRCPAAVRFLSMEPLLGAVDLHLMRPAEHLKGPCGGGSHLERRRFLHWVIAGGESGKGARPCSIEWIRSIIGQCKAAGVPAFVKQLGNQPWSDDGSDDYNMGNALDLDDPKGGDWSEWPEDLRVRDMPEAAKPRAAEQGPPALGGEG